MADKEESIQDLQKSLANSSNSEPSLDGKRMNVLRNVMNKTVDSYIARLKLLEPMKNVNREYLSPLHKEALSQLKTNIKCELEEIYKENNVEKLLDGLDQLVVEASEKHDSKSNNAWRPSGNPNVDSLAHIKVLKLQKLDVLKETLEKLETTNKILQEKVKKGETQLLKTYQDKIVSKAEDLKEMVEEQKLAVHIANDK